jgi:hypothetical protein
MVCDEFRDPLSTVVRCMIDYGGTYVKVRNRGTTPTHRCTYMNILDRGAVDLVMVSLLFIIEEGLNPIAIGNTTEM